MPDNKKPVATYHKCSQYQIPHKPDIDCLCTICNDPRCDQCDYRASLSLEHCKTCVKFAEGLNLPKKEAETEAQKEAERQVSALISKVSDSEEPQKLGRKQILIIGSTIWELGR